MSMRPIAVILTLAALAGCTTSNQLAARAAAASQAATSSGGASITLRNRSNWAILSIYLSPVSQTSWGPDQLGANVLHTGETFTLTGVSCDHYDLKLVDEDRDECVLRDVDICHEDAGWTIDNDDLLTCQAFTRRQQGQ